MDDVVIPSLTTPSDLSLQIRSTNVHTDKSVGHKENWSSPGFSFDILGVCLLVRAQIPSTKELR